VAERQACVIPEVGASCRVQTLEGVLHVSKLRMQTGKYLGHSEEIACWLIQPSSSIWSNACDLIGRVQSLAVTAAVQPYHGLLRSMLGLSSCWLFISSDIDTPAVSADPSLCAELFVEPLAPVTWEGHC